jgi:hypothetical protein
MSTDDKVLDNLFLNPVIGKLSLFEKVNHLPQHSGISHDKSMITGNNKEILHFL